MYGLFPALGRSGCGRAAARGCVCALHVATLRHSVGLRRGAVRGRGGVQHAAALERGVRMHRGRSVGSCRGAACGCAGEPHGARLEGGSLAHRRSSGRRDCSGCCGCALPGAHGGDLPACPRTARERERRGAARIPWGLHSTAGVALACGLGRERQAGSRGPGLR